LTKLSNRLTNCEENTDLICVCTEPFKYAGHIGKNIGKQDFYLYFCQTRFFLNQFEVLITKCVQHNFRKLLPKTNTILASFNSEKQKKTKEDFL